MSVRSAINQVTVPAWAREWGSPQATAALIARLPTALTEIATEQWRDAYSELDRTPAGRGLRDEVIRSFNTRIRKTLAAGRTLSLYGVGVAATHDHVRAAAKDLAAHASVLLGSPAMGQGGAAWKDFARARGLDPTDDADKARAIDPAYWRHRIRTTAWQDRERMWLTLAPDKIEAWCSDDCSRSWEEDQEKQAEWMSKAELVEKNTGEIVSLAEITKGRDRKQFARLMTFAQGMATMGAREGLKPCLITVTPPGHMHASTTAGGAGRRPNPDWDGSTPHDQHKKLSAQWRTCCNALRDIGEGRWWIRTVQPQRGGDCHWHIIMFSADAAAVEQIIRRHFDADDPTDEARYRHGVDISPIEGGIEGVMSYVARALGYITRSLSPTSTEADTEEARRTAAWCRTWNIRRFQCSQSYSTLWDLIYSGSVEVGGAAAAAVDAGDFDAFVRAVESEGLKPAYTDTTTKYGETSRKVIGIQNSDDVVFVKTREWTLQCREATDGAGHAVMPINQERGAHARVEEENNRLNNRIEAGEVAGGAPPGVQGLTNHSTTNTEQAARRAAFVRELEAEVAAWV